MVINISLLTNLYVQVLALLQTIFGSIVAPKAIINILFLSPFEIDSCKLETETLYIIHVFILIHLIQKWLTEINTTIKMALHYLLKIEDGRE